MDSFTSETMEFITEEELLESDCNLGNMDTVIQEVLVETLAEIDKNVSVSTDNAVCEMDFSDELEFITEEQFFETLEPSSKNMDTVIQEVLVETLVDIDKNINATTDENIPTNVTQHKLPTEDADCIAKEYLKASENQVTFENVDVLNFESEVVNEIVVSSSFSDISNEPIVPMPKVRNQKNVSLSKIRKTTKKEQGYRTFQKNILNHIEEWYKSASLIETIDAMKIQDFAVKTARESCPALLLDRNYIRKCLTRLNVNLSPTEVKDLHKNWLENVWFRKIMDK